MATPRIDRGNIMYVSDDNKCSYLYCERLRDWLLAKKKADKSFKNRQFADDVGLSHSRLSGMKNGVRQFVSARVINNIAIATNDAVTLADYVARGTNWVAPEGVDDE